MIDTISTLVDEIILEKPIDYESVNFEAAKQMAILGGIEQYQNIMESNMSAGDKKLSLIAVLSYLTLENTVLWITNHKSMRDQ